VGPFIERAANLIVNEIRFVRMLRARGNFALGLTFELQSRRDNRLRPG
jgi:hypothetical protein